MKTITACRSCGSAALNPFLHLGDQPLADALVDPSAPDLPEPTYPLEVAFCSDCTLVQILHEVPPEQLFVDNYLYFSSFSDHLLAHSRAHAETLIREQGLGSGSLVIEVASNDGYLLRTFAEQGIDVLGIDPAPEPAAAAEAAGIPTLREFFGIDLARTLRADGRIPDVIIANNVMAHVPDLGGFVAGLAELIAEDGVITIENPSVEHLIAQAQFDTIYHEHHCYLSTTSVNNLVRRHGLYLNDVERFPDLHGGTLRWWCGRRSEPTDRVRDALVQEARQGVADLANYTDFAGRVEANLVALRELLHRRKAEGRRIAAYGAAAKGSTLLNAAGIGTDVIDFVVDRNTHKQGLCMPGVHLPIRPPEALLDEQPDDVLLLAWNFAEEIMDQQQAYRDRGGCFIVPVPQPVVVA